MEKVYQFWPHNLLTQIIIIFLFALFLLWGGMLVNAWLRYQKVRKQIIDCIDIRMLVEALRSRSARNLITAEEGAAFAVGQKLMADQSSPGQERSNFAMHNVSPYVQSAQITFVEYKKKKKLSDSIIARHIQAIFNSGWEGSHLEISELIKHTKNELFEPNTMLRAVLAVFIVIGLLGTLFGLAESLAHLSDLLRNQDAAKFPVDSLMVTLKDLKELLSNLKSAFVPSILGVLCTVIGMIVFSLYLRIACLPLSRLLEQTTLTIWIPQLLPTAVQKQIDALQRSEEQLQQRFESAEKVVDFANELEDELGKLSPTIKRANKSLNTMAKFADGINEFSERFEENVDKLSKFQEDINELYNEIHQQSETFHNYLQGRIETTDETQRDTLEALQSQNKKMEILINALNQYQRDYAEERRRIDSKSEAILESAQRLVEDADSRNAALINDFGKPLADTLTKELGRIEYSFADSMNNLLAHLNNPSPAGQGAQDGTTARLTQSQIQLSKAIENQTTAFKDLDASIKTLTGNLVDLGKDALPVASTRSQARTRRETPATDVSPQKRSLIDRLLDLFKR